MRVFIIKPLEMSFAAVAFGPFIKAWTGNVRPCSQQFFFSSDSKYETRGLVSRHQIFLCSGAGSGIL